MIHSLFFIEGCLNGGGQIAAASNAERNELLVKVTDLYGSAKCAYPSESEPVQAIVRDWLDGSLDSPKAQRLLFTDFQEVEQISDQFSVKW